MVTINLGIYTRIVNKSGKLDRLRQIIYVDCQRVYGVFKQRVYDRLSAPPKRIQSALRILIGAERSERTRLNRPNKF